MYKKEETIIISKNYTNEKEIKVEGIFGIEKDFIYDYDEYEEEEVK